jgi:phenylalanyl-tRNA synthetase alpha subunit
MPKEGRITDLRFAFKINRAIGPLRYIDEIDENKVKIKFMLNKIINNLELKSPLSKIETAIQKIEENKEKIEEKINNIKKEVESDIQNMKDNPNKIYKEISARIDLIKKNIDPQKYEEKISSRIDLIKKNIGIYKRSGLKLVEEVLS